MVDPQNKISGCAALNGALHNPQEYALTSSLTNALLDIIRGQNLEPYTLKGQHLESGAIIVVSDPKHPFTVKHHNLSQQAFVIDSMAITQGLQSIAKTMRLNIQINTLRNLFNLQLQATAKRVKLSVPHLTSGIPVWTVKLNGKGQVIQITEQQSL